MHGNTLSGNKAPNCIILDEIDGNWHWHCDYNCDYTQKHIMPFNIYYTIPWQHLLISHHVIIVYYTHTLSLSLLLLLLLLLFSLFSFIFSFLFSFFSFLFSFSFPLILLGIDGRSSIDLLVQIINCPLKRKKSGRSNNNAFPLTRPLICICVRSLYSILIIMDLSYTYILS